MKKNRIEKECLICGKKIEVLLSLQERKKYCSKICQNKSRTLIVGKVHHSYKEEVSLMCEYCHVEFLVKPHQKNRRKYCSKSCAGKSGGYQSGKYHLNWKEERRTCKNCGRELVRHDKKTERCRACFALTIVGVNNYRWAGGKSTCIDCGQITSSCSSKRCIDCYAKYNKKENHSCWMGGVTPINQQIRNSNEYQLLRQYIFERDSYTCILCNERGRKLQMHHIQLFSIHKELRLEKKNLITLCKYCHKYLRGEEELYKDYFDILILGREE